MRSLCNRGHSPADTAILRRVSLAVELPDQMKTYLIQELWNIGDLIQLTSLAQALRAAYAGCRIIWVIASGQVTFSEYVAGPFDELIFFDAPWTHPARKYNPAKYSIQAWQRTRMKLKELSIDAAFDIRGDIRSNVLLATWPARKRYIIADPKLDSLHWVPGAKTVFLPQQNILRHTRCQFLASKFDSGLNCPLPMLCGMPRRDPVKRDPLRVVWHPGARFKNRACPLELVERTIKEASHNSIEAQGMEWTVVLGPEHRTEAEKLRDELGQVQVLLPDLIELPRIFKDQDLAIVCDSGPMHIASALGLAVLGLYAYDTRPEWEPYGSLNEVLFPKQGPLPAAKRYLNLDMRNSQPLDGIFSSQILETIASIGKRLPLASS